MGRRRVEALGTDTGLALLNWDEMYPFLISFIFLIKELVSSNMQKLLQRMSKQTSYSF